MRLFLSGNPDTKLHKALEKSGHEVVLGCNNNEFISEVDVIVCDLESDHFGIGTYLSAMTLEIDTISFIDKKHKEISPNIKRSIILRTQIHLI